MTKPACPYAPETQRVGAGVSDILTHLGKTLYGTELGAVVVTFCERCSCWHTAVVSPDGRVSARAVHALQSALNQLKETHDTSCN